MCLLLLGDSPGSTDEDPGSHRSREPARRTCRREPGSRAAYAKYDCDHIYQTPSDAAECHGPADLAARDGQTLPALQAKSLMSQASRGMARAAGNLKNALAGVAEQRINPADEAVKSIYAEQGLNRLDST